MRLFYFETRWTASSDWCANVSETEPQVEKGRQINSGGLGPRVRAVQEVNADHYRFTLNELREVYSPDGRLRNT
ncbi:hypothetical protein [Cognatishimia sp. MH4019]|uniref:hypothetical protein n=1 Tax=Cognatishimia sp. MH4019 TaxID=2854030 RepID=UPI001CD23B00|nr:hypothetical protein [Cognatishimia sp. MH4019]